MYDSIDFSIGCARSFIHGAAARERVNLVHSRTDFLSLFQFYPPPQGLKPAKQAAPPMTRVRGRRQRIALSQGVGKTIERVRDVQKRGKAVFLMSAEAIAAWMWILCLCTILLILTLGLAALFGGHLMEEYAEIREQSRPLMKVNDTVSATADHMQILSSRLRQMMRPTVSRLHDMSERLRPSRP